MREDNNYHSQCLVQERAGASVPNLVGSHVLPCVPCLLCEWHTRTQGLVCHTHVHMSARAFAPVWHCSAKGKGGGGAHVGLDDLADELARRVRGLLVPDERDHALRAPGLRLAVALHLPRGDVGRTEQRAQSSSAELHNPSCPCAQQRSCFPSLVCKSGDRLKLMARTCSAH